MGIDSLLLPSACPSLELGCRHKLPPRVLIGWQKGHIPIGILHHLSPKGFVPEQVDDEFSRELANLDLPGNAY